MARSYIGAKVRLLRDIKTNGGVTFRKGVMMKVIASTPHGLTLNCYVRGWPKSVRNVNRYEVEVVEWPKKKED